MSQTTQTRTSIQPIVILSIWTKPAFCAVFVIHWRAMFTTGLELSPLSREPSSEWKAGWLISQYKFPPTHTMPLRVMPCVLFEMNPRCPEPVRVPSELEANASLLAAAIRVGPTIKLLTLLPHNEIPTGLVLLMALNLSVCTRSNRNP